MHRRITAALALALVSGSAAAQSFTWNNPAGGSWNTAANWLPVGVPSAAGQSATLGAGSYTVSLDINPTLDAVNINSATAALNMPGRSITLIPAGLFTTSGIVTTVGGANTIAGKLVLTGTGRVNINDATNLNLSRDIQNAGIITIGATGGGSFTDLNITSNLTASGSGSLQLTGATFSRLVTPPGVTLTNAAGHTISGAGQIMAAVANAGVITSNAGGTLQLDSTGKTNSGTISAVNGTLVVAGTTVTQTPTGLVLANGGPFNLASANITGGTMEGRGTSAVVNVSGSTTINDVTVLGSFNINNATAVTAGGTALTNNGLITLGATGGSSFTDFYAVSNLALNGTGTFVLTTATFPRLLTVTDTTLTQAASHTIRGAGQVLAVMVNNGMVSADISGATMSLDTNNKTNNATFRGKDGGIMQIQGITVTQGPAGQIIADGGAVNLNNAGVTGGALRTTGTSAISVVGSAATLTGVQNFGRFNINNATSGVLSTSFRNDGTVKVGATSGGSFTDLLVANNLTITGTGQIDMDLQTFPRLRTNPGVTVTNSATHLIRGGGQVLASLVNDGIINADRSVLALDTADKTNNNKMASLTGGRLDINGIAITQGVGGEIAASGSNVNLNSAAIIGGKITSIVGNAITTATGASRLQDVTCNASLNINNATAMQLTGSFLTNNGTITLGATAGGSFTDIVAFSNVALNGTGQLVLQNITLPRLLTDAGNVITNAATHTIRGSGEIGGRVLNNGAITADVSGAPLSLTTNPKTNNATIRAVGGAFLDSNTGITQGPAGQIIADGGTVRLTNGSITGGALRTTGGSVIASVGGVPTLDGVSNFGAYNVNNATGTVVTGSLRNDGTITVGATAGGSFTDLSFGGAVTVTGSGRITLNSQTFPRLISTSGTLTNASGHTIGGNGEIIGTLTNSGIIAPGASAGRLSHTSGAFKQTSAGEMQIELGGTGSGQFDVYAMSNGLTADLAGTVRVSYTGGYVTALNHAFLFLPCTNVVGKFDTLIAPNPGAADRRWRLSYTAQGVVLRNTCNVDMNGDGKLDIQDFSDFQNKFALSNPEADINGDGSFDIRDFSAFQNKFALGCV